MMLASFNGYTSIVDLLIRNKVELNHCDRLDRNSLHYSARYDNVKMSLYLLNQGINYKKLDVEDLTPVDLAKKFKSNNAFKAITDWIADKEL